MKCFQCKFPDCRYNGKMTEWEKEQYRRAHTKTYDMSEEDKENCTQKGETQKDERLWMKYEG